MSDDLLAILAAPRYIPADVARFTGLHPQRVKRWLQGYEYTSRTTQRTGKGVTRQLLSMVPASGNRHPHHVSFLDLLDLKFVKACLDAGVRLSVRKICERLAKAKEISGASGQLYTKQQYFITWKRIYMEVDGHLEQLPDKQRALDSVIRPSVQEVQFDHKPPAMVQEIESEIKFDQQTQLAYKWFPKDGQGQVVIDPQMAFGAPVVNGTRIKTNVLADHVLIAKRTIDDIASDMRLRPEQVQAAVLFEQKLAA